MRLVLVTFVLASGSVVAQSALPPLTTEARLKWASGTVSVQNLAGGIFASAWGKRYAMRLTGTSTSDAMEAGLGALWGEDRNGNTVPAYARYAAIPGILDRHLPAALTAEK
jgi:hypothetical protein